MSASPLVYVDTNILVSYALGEERDAGFPTAEKFFGEVAKGNYVVLVSSFVLSEALHTLRNIATEQVYREAKNGLSQQDLIDIANSREFRDEVNDRSLGAFKTIIGFITTDPDHFKFGDLKTVYLEEMFQKALKTLSEGFGEFRVYRSRCPKCDSPIACYKCGFDSKIVYKSVNAPDLTHLLISTSLGCKYLFTMDKYFAKIPKNESQSEIKVIF